MPPGHRFPMAKYRQVREAVQSKLINDNNHNSVQRIQCEFRVSPLATFEQLSTTHCAEYVSSLLVLCARFAT